MYEFREKAAQESGMELLVHINPDGIKKNNINPLIMVARFIQTS